MTHCTSGHVLKAVRRLASLFFFLVSSHSLLFFLSKHSVDCLLNEKSLKEKNKVNLYAMLVPSVLLNAFGKAGSHTSEWNERVWESEFSVLTWNKSRPWRYKACSGLFSACFFVEYLTVLLPFPDFEGRQEIWKTGKRPTSAVFGELGVQE